MQLRNIMVVLAMVLSLVSVQVWAHGDDKALTKTVKEKLSADPEIADMIKTNKIKVHAKNGDVTLSGKVESDDQKKSIEDTVKAVDGVKSVEDKHLKVEKHAGKAGKKVMADPAASQEPSTTGQQSDNTSSDKSTSSY